MVTANSFAEVAASVTAEPQLLPRAGSGGSGGENRPISAAGDPRSSPALAALGGSLRCFFLPGSEAALCLLLGCSVCDVGFFVFR